MGEVEEFAKKHFNSICPYTNKKCDSWICADCEVEKQEREYIDRDEE